MLPPESAIRRAKREGTIRVPFSDGSENSNSLSEIPKMIVLTSQATSNHLKKKSTICVIRVGLVFFCFFLFFTVFLFRIYENDERYECISYNTVSQICRMIRLTMRKSHYEMLLIFGP